LECKRILQEEAKMKKNMDDFRIRFATIDDTALILDFIKELAAYEHMLQEVVATEELIRETVFRGNKAEVLIGEYQKEPVAFALFFHNYSTFLARPGIYLEDLYVKEAYRNMGFGKRILSYLAKLAQERGCGRLEWSCLDWNEPSIGFYKSIGSVPMDQWTVYRLQGEALEQLAANNE
jgi:GNAT superfamily N-acetyltransferase